MPVPIAGARPRVPSRRPLPRPAVPWLLASVLLFAVGASQEGAAQQGELQGQGTERAVEVTDGLTEAELDRRTAELASRLRCPICRNQSVLESSSDLARRMQSVIRERLAAGESTEEVEAYFVSRYGDWILLQPEPEGLNLLVYVLPGVVLLAGVILVIVTIRRWTGSGPPSEARPSPDRDPGAGRAPERESPP